MGGRDLGGRGDEEGKRGEAGSGMRGDRRERAKNLNGNMQQCSWGEPLESSRDMGCERLPGLSGDDLRLNA